MDKTMARIKLRLFSSMSLSLLAAGLRGQVAVPSRILSEGFQRCLGPRRLVDLGQRPLKVLGNLGEAPLYRACPSDQDIIVAWDGVPRGYDPHRLLQAPPRPVAHDRAAKRLARREAEAGAVGGCRFRLAARAPEARAMALRSAIRLSHAGIQRGS